MKKGMTLVELLVAMAIIIIVVGIIYSLYSYAFTQTMFFEWYWPGQSSAQFSMFMITKYLHNASTATVNPASYNATGNYIIFKNNTLYRRVNSTTVSTNVIAKNIQSVSFQATGTPPNLWVKIGIGVKTNANGSQQATLTTLVFLNNASIQNTPSTKSGTSLFYK